MNTRKFNIGDKIKTAFGPAKIFNFYTYNYQLFAQVRFNTVELGNVAISTMTEKVKGL